MVRKRYHFYFYDNFGIFILILMIILSLVSYELQRKPVLATSPGSSQICGCAILRNLNVERQYTSIAVSSLQLSVNPRPPHHCNMGDHGSNSRGTHPPCYLGLVSMLGIVSHVLLTDLLSWQKISVLLSVHI